MPANIAVNSSGWIVTSKSCSELRRIFLTARQAMAIVWVTVSADRRPDGQVATPAWRGRGDGLVDRGGQQRSSGHLHLVVWTRVGLVLGARGRSGP